MKKSKPKSGLLSNLSTILTICIIALMVQSCKNTQNGNTTEIINSHRQTYCNPIDIDYTYSIVNTANGISYRSGADPAIVNYKNEYYLFVTRSLGYWHSKDLSNWEFVRPQRWYFESTNAPGAWPLDSAILLLGNPCGYMSLLSANNPLKGNWQAQPALIPLTLHDPAIFVDDDGRIYIYEGSSNTFPIVGVELDPKNYFLPIGKPVELINLNSGEHGWERFGENHISEINPFIEGAWMTKHNGKYYLQYAAPGTQWNVYADGVYVGDHPLGPFSYEAYNPVSYKPGGFVVGAGHGSTVKDNFGEYWHFATSRISVNYQYERRIVMFPAGFDVEGQMFVNSSYGDYPHFIPGLKKNENHDAFPQWMLLSFEKPVTASSVKEFEVMRRIDASEGGWQLPVENVTYNPANVADENIQTFWLAKTNGTNEWLEIDLQDTAQVFAVQINYHDFNSNIFGKPDTLYHQFKIEYSLDRQNWEVAFDGTGTKHDRPNAYIELSNPVKARYIKYSNIHVPTLNLAISGFRIFGKGSGKVPATPLNFSYVRGKDDRNALLSWNSVDNAQGYTLYWGIENNKLNNSVMIYKENTYELRALNKGQKYYFAVEAFNGNGISAKQYVN